MKVKFVNGVAGHRGAMVIPFEGRMVAGRYNIYQYKNEREIVVVKQRSIWFTILIFIHELAHYIARELPNAKMRGRMNIWIDKHIIRNRDKNVRR